MQSQVFVSGAAPRLRRGFDADDETLPENAQRSGLCASGVCIILYTTNHMKADLMRSTTFTVRVDTGVKKRLERLAKSTGRSRSFLAADAINEYLEVNEWQVAGIKRAIASLDRGEGIPHDSVKNWVASWGSANEKRAPKRK
jgi:RHH-type transcriptional regulator, rel operon repressor / antitoxin RelB